MSEPDERTNYKTETVVFDSGAGGSYYSDNAGEEDSIECETLGDYVSQRPAKRYILITEFPSALSDHLGGAGQITF